MKSKIRIIIRHIKRLNYIIEPKHRRKLPRLFACIFLSSILELLGITAILPFVYAMMDMDTVINDSRIRPFVDLFHIYNQQSLLVAMGVALIILYIIKNAFLVFTSTYQFNFSSRVQRELQVKMLHSFLTRPYQFFLDTTVAEIDRSCNTDIDRVFATIQTLLSLIMSILTAAMVGVFMIATEPVIAVGMLVVAVVCIIVLTKVFKPATSRLAAKTIGFQVKKGDAFNKTVYGIKELMVMGRQELFIDDYNKALERIQKVSVRQAFVSILPNRIIETFFVGGFMIVVLGRILSGGDPASFVPTLAAFALGAFKVLPYISGITNKLNSLIYDVPFIEKAYKNLKEAEEYQLECEAYSKINKSEDNSSGNEKIHFEDVTEVKNVFWQYSKGNEPVLTNASLTINRGEAIGFVGPSGAGKTTLADIILGLLHPQKGAILMDGKDIFAMKKVWSKIVGYVPQSVFLIVGTIRDNVAFGMRDFSDDDIWEALDQAQLGDFVRGLPEGLDTQTGERGIKLSGGQRQRIAIARALANKPELLILDEATSALDNETEAAIMESIDSLQGRLTMIIVAHRLTTIKNCDRIYRICDGVAKEVSYEELVSG